MYGQSVLRAKPASLFRSNRNNEQNQARSTAPPALNEITQGSQTLDATEKGMQETADLLWPEQTISH